MPQAAGSDLTKRVRVQGAVPRAKTADETDQFCILEPESATNLAFPPPRANRCASTPFGIQENPRRIDTHSNELRSRSLRDNDDRGGGSQRRPLACRKLAHQRRPLPQWDAGIDLRTVVFEE